MKNIYLLLFVICFGCTNEKSSTIEDLKIEVWKTVQLHNAAWSQLEDLSELRRYVAENVISVPPPYKTPLYGKKAYLKSYQNWINHASVDYFIEIDPQIELYLDGRMAIVTFEIEMSFEYDGIKTSEWKGRDLMTLKYENDQWLLVSDVFVKYSED